MKTIKNVHVLIVGGGPEGLSMALALARHNIQTLVVERHSGTTNYPRTRGVITRTIELYRQWGNADELLGHEQPKVARRFIWTPSLLDEELARTSVDDAHLQYLSPIHSSFITQNYQEKLLETISRIIHFRLVHDLTVVEMKFRRAGAKHIIKLRLIRIRSYLR